MPHRARVGRCEVQREAVGTASPPARRFVPTGSSSPAAGVQTRSLRGHGKRGEGMLGGSSLRRSPEIYALANRRAALLVSSCGHRMKRTDAGPPGPGFSPGGSPDLGLVRDVHKPSVLRALPSPEDDPPTRRRDEVAGGCKRSADERARYLVVPAGGCGVALRRSTCPPTSRSPLCCVIQPAC